MKILIGVTGSIAAYKAADLISRLKKRGHQIEVIATNGALQFIGEATIEGLAGRPVAKDIFEPGRMMDHVRLARWADAFVVAPLSAHHVSALARGEANDLLSATALAYERAKPFLVAPAMNVEMWSHPATQENIKLLKQYGARIIEPTEGLLACGEVGAGRMAEPATIEKAIAEALRVPKNIPVLITFGGTREVIDGVRAITNSSTGQTGAELSDLFHASGFEVSAIAATSAVMPIDAQVVAKFETHADLNDKLRDHLRAHPTQAVIHVAAVSDFSVDAIGVGERTFSPSAEVKLSSDNRMVLHLKRNPKIVNLLKEYARDLKLKVIAFKLTKSADPREREEASLKLLNSPGVDYVVHNDLSGAEQESHKRPFTIYSKGQPPLAVKGTQDLASILMALIAGESPRPRSDSREGVRNPEARP